jgi:hypothetical protein
MEGVEVSSCLVATCGNLDGVRITLITSAGIFEEEESVI